MSQAPSIEISPTMTMEEILSNYPSAKRALFQKFHIGGCSSCGYAMSDTLEEVLINHNKAQATGDAIEQIYESARVDEMMQISPAELKKELADGNEWKLIDVREDYETQEQPMPNSEVLTQEVARDMLQKWPRETKIAFFCSVGSRSLEAASYFKGHGLPNVKSLKGGIQRWLAEVESAVSV